MNIVARFEIQYHQLLNEHGKINGNLPEFAKNHQQLIEMYRLMTLVRVFDKKAVALQRTGRTSTYPENIGNEAISVGMGYALKSDDVFCPYYRENGTLLKRGVTLQEILAYWGGDERGNHFKNKEDLSICVPIASQCLHAAGVATAFKLRKQKRAALVVVGDGGTSEGDFYESLNVAGVWNLPLVVVVTNNQWAISIPSNQQTAAKTFAQKSIAAGFEGCQVDGNDVIAVRDVVEKALEKARNGNGPTLIEAISYRLSNHTTADDAKRYREEDELKKAWEKDPLQRLKNYLIQQNVWSSNQEEKLLDECSLKVEEAVQDYLNQSTQSLESIFNYIYEKRPKILDEQYKEIMENNDVK